ncbi:hypothetical protein G4Y79_19495 [Phototrophicus methaneseepsis]|uniref:Uncharacterized protein n=1 Tax=Phototrophicus methaneseepsis TaxID=2710758 RepID=A0A7S8E7M7_9CHLR|nr:hypothetical protein [Phototrophicus methaneseepsis]QPC81851.1 hypothetical protein G4Y79_19495 [Phototrophicus methaneseepsis]
MASDRPPFDPTKMTQQFFSVVQISQKNLFDRLLVPLLLAFGILFTGSRVFVGDWPSVVFSLVPIVLLVLLAAIPRLKIVLGRPFDRNHAMYLTFFWVYLQLWLWTFRLLAVLEPSGKDSRLYYVFLILFIAVTFRVMLTVFALTPRGYAVFFSKIPTWEQVMVALNEFIAAGLLAYVGGNELARILQPNVLSLRTDPVYTGGLLFMFGLYYLLIQMMWIQSWNEWLSRNKIWVRLVRLLAPLALVVVTLVIVRHFSRLSDTRTADLIGTANLDQTVLALSPIIWLMVFLVAALVYSGGKGLRQRFLPDALLDRLPDRLSDFLSTISDMDMLLVAMLLMTTIPVQIILFNDGSIGVIQVLQQEIARQNALIDSSEQALALLFALPFYILAVGLLALYAWAMAKPSMSARERDDLVDKLPVGLLILFIIALYLCAIPFSQVLTEGRLPQLPQELGRLLAFDILIPLILLYAHFYPFVRIPYGYGQARWREQYSKQLEENLRDTERQLEVLEAKIQSSEYIWQNRRNWRANEEERFNMLFDLIDHNGERDRLNMARLRMVDERQRLAEISEAPVSLTIARLPSRIVSYGIPLLLAFKIYEWAVVNDGLREVANNPNIGVIEFFQTILEQTQF